MTGQEIIDKYRVLTDSQDDLSDSELLGILNKRYREVLTERDWEFLRKSATGSVTTADPLEITFPSDFVKPALSRDRNGELRYIMYMGTDYEEYEFINMGERRLYRDTKSYVYPDYRQSKFVFTAPEDSARAYEFDYIYEPDDITTSTSPVIPSRYHNIFPHLMATDFSIIDATEGQTYDNQNFNQAMNLFAQMQLEDANRKELL